MSAAVHHGFTYALKLGNCREQSFQSILRGTYSGTSKTGTITTEQQSYWSHEFALGCRIILPTVVKRKMVVHYSKPVITMAEVVLFVKREVPAAGTATSTAGKVTTGGYAPEHDIASDYGDCSEDSFERVLRGDSTGVLTVEAKSHMKFHHTGNIAVEFSQRDWTNGGSKPSGIALSTATYWAHEVAQDCWIVIPTELQRKMNHDHIAGGGDTLVCGDNENACSLIHMQKLIKYCQGEL